MLDSGVIQYQLQSSVQFLMKPSPAKGEGLGEGEFPLL
jgi:hypothetical protein